MDGDGKKPLKTAIIEFLSLIQKKRKRIYSETFQKSVHRAAIYKWIKKFETTGNCNRKYGS